MALSTKHRLALYEHFRPDLGDEVTEALLAEFPARDGDELVTKEFLRAELAESSGSLRAEMYDGFAAMNRHLTNVIVGMTSVFVVALGIATTLVIAFGG